MNSSGADSSTSALPTALHPGSQLSQLLSSLGVSTSEDGSDVHEPQGPDPLVVSRGRLTKLRADVEYGSSVLKSLADRTNDTAQCVVRLTPPITNKQYTGQAPPFAFVVDGEDVGQFVERLCRGEDGVTYTPCRDKGEAILVVRNVVLALIDHFETLRTQLVAEAQARIDETMKRAKNAGILADGSENAADTDTVMDEDGRVLNEEGLPFVDPMEVEAPDTSVNTDRPSAVAKFEPQRKLSGQQRKKWIDSVFDRFEGQAEDEHEGEDSDEQQPDAQDEEEEEKQTIEEERQSLIAELQQLSKAKAQAKAITSTPSPAPSKPLKSALKHSATPQPSPPPPKFGSQGIRRGFLNMNPSSPAAEASSSPVTTPTVTPANEFFATLNKRKDHEEEQDTAVVEKLTQTALDSPAPVAPTKKHVRIQSPERPVPSKSDVHPDDVGVEDEAARIVNLLGPTVVAGTPAGDEALSEMKRVQESEEKAQRQAQEAIRAREEKARKARESGKPAVGSAVMERAGKAQQRPASTTTSAVQAQIQQAKASAFKRGFLTSRPAVSTSKAPVGSVDPRTSLGMSALDRSLINDGPIEEERSRQGLPPAVPHARPSKAYAEKMDRRKRGEDVDGSENTPASPAVVGTGSESGKSKVKFQLDDRAGANTGDGDNDEDVSSDDDMAEAELDEHDEEAFVRAAYASGDISDNEAGPSSSSRRGRKAASSKGKSKSNHTESADSASDDSDWDLDSDSYGYDSSDLADLEPTFDGLVSDLENAELAREYALAKARQMEARSKMTADQRRDLERAITGEKDRSTAQSESTDLWTEEEIDGRHLSSMSADRDVHPEGYGGPPNKMSRFRASRIVKALGLGDSSVGVVPHLPEAQLKEGMNEEDSRADAAGHDLAHLLENAANIGPEGEGVQSGSSRRPHTHAHPLANRGYSYAMKEGHDDPTPPVMVLPSLTPLRYPRSNNTNESESKMMALDEHHPIPRDGIDLEGETDEDEENDHLLDVMRARLAERDQRHAHDGDGDDGSVLPPKPRAKKREEGDGGMDKVSGSALSAPPLVGSTRSTTTGPQAQKEQTFPSVAPPKVSRFKAARSGAGGAAVPQQEEASAEPTPSTTPPKVSRFKASRSAGGVVDQQGQAEDVASNAQEPLSAPAKVSRFKAARMAKGEE